ncbi:MAG: serine hydrolase domain-containing protein, partial [Janthinobacterium lividum]
RLFDPLGMTDTTFWPTVAQQRRLAKSYRPNAARDGLEEIQITSLRYPLDDPARQPYSGGGLFSTAPDLVRFCQMIFRGGRDEARTYLSPESIAEMTRKQTGDTLEASYGLGWDVGSNTYGHGGAYATLMTMHPSQGLITIFLVQHDGFPLDGDQSRETFVRIATESQAAH